MNRHLRIAIAKPDFRITGGFELVMARVEAELVARGHEVSWRPVDVIDVTHAPFGLDVPDPVWAASPEFFRYLAMVDAFQRVDTSGADVVISTQPPSFAVEHPRQLALFSHHLRVYYDLSEEYVAAGFVDPVLHAEAQARVREVDQRALDAVRWLLAASPEVQRRLATYNGLVDNVGVYLAGVAFRDRMPAATGAWGAPGAEAPTNVLCVSRHEWPKRTELFVEAMKHLPALKGSMVGVGGRLPWVKTIDARLSEPGALEAVDSSSLWMNTGEIAQPLDPPRRSNVRYLSHVPDSKLDRLFAGALCVVAPAFREDYGLTAIEAMAYGKPIIVCEDGGGLTDSVIDGENGLVVEPTGRAIAAAVQRLAGDRDLAVRLGARSLEMAAEYTWERAMAQIDEGLERVAS